MIYYKIQEQTLKVGKFKGERVKIARATGRKRTSTKDFCRLIADSTTFDRHEVQGIINRMAEVAQRELLRGNSIEMGDFGTLSPSFKSEAVPIGTDFNATKHIHSPRVRMRLKPAFAGLLNYETKYSELKESDMCPAPNDPPHTEPSQPSNPSTPPSNGGGEEQTGM